MGNGTVTVTYEEPYGHGGDVGPYKRVNVSWIANTTGTAIGTIQRMVGSLIKAITDPDGTAVPTNDYDIAITDDESVNVLANCDTNLTNCSASVTVERYFFVKNAATAAMATFPVVASDLTFTVTNAGNAGAGQTILYFKVR